LQVTCSAGALAAAGANVGSDLNRSSASNEIKEAALGISLLQLPEVRAAMGLRMMSGQVCFGGEIERGRGGGAVVDGSC